MSPLFEHVSRSRRAFEGKDTLRQPQDSPPRPSSCGREASKSSRLKRRRSDAGRPKRTRAKSIGKNRHVVEGKRKGEERRKEEQRERKNWGDIGEKEGVRKGNGEKNR